MDKLFSALSLCKKAGGLVAGFDAVNDCLNAEEAVLVLLAQDLSPKTRERVLRNAGKRHAVRSLPYTQQEMAAIVQKPTGVFAVVNQDLAVLCQKALPDKEETV